MKTKTTLLAAALLLAIAAAVPLDRAASAHFGLVSSEPAADGSVPAVEWIRLTFTQVPQENSVSVRLIDPSGDAVETGEAVPDREDAKTVHVSVEKMLVASEYTVAWRGIGDDGHVVRGDFVFSVTAPN